MEALWDKIGPYLSLFGAFTAFMTAVATVTPTKKDDKIVSVLDKIGSIADRFGIQFKKQI